MHKDGWKVPNICKKLVVLDRHSVYFHFSYKLNSTTFTSTANTSRQYHFYLFQVSLPGYILMTKLVSFNFLQTIERQPSCANKEKNKRMKKTFIFRTGGRWEINESTYSFLLQRILLGTIQLITVKKKNQIKLSLRR